MPIMRNYTLVLAVIGLSFIGGSHAQVANTNTQSPVAQSTPSKKFTAAAKSEFAQVRASSLVTEKMANVH